jgi:hypothetical protein
MADDSQQAQALPALSRRHRGKGIVYRVKNSATLLQS